jgi:hypothetical protein
VRITRDMLLRIARETAQKRAFEDPSLVAAYLTGSLRSENPFLGNTTDVDIVFIHPNTLPRHREVVALTPEVHLDILHVPQSDYAKPRELRLNPWLGPELYDPLPLLVSGHFFEFVQAGVRDKFNEPESIFARARTSASHARQIWSGLQISTETGLELLLSYLKSIIHAANAVALMVNDKPLAERRFLLQFPRHAEEAGKPELADALLDLLGARDVDMDGEMLTACLAAWENDFITGAGMPGVEPRIALPRLGYYKLACQSILQGESPYTILWPLLLTWTLAAKSLPASQRKTWESTCLGLGLLGSGFSEKLTRLDHFLDVIEEMLEKDPS